MWPHVRLFGRPHASFPSPHMHLVAWLSTVWIQCMVVSRATPPVQFERQKKAPSHGSRTGLQMLCKAVVRYENPSPALTCGTPAPVALGGRFRTAPFITLFIPGTPLKTTHPQKHA